MAKPNRSQMTANHTIRIYEQIGRVDYVNQREWALRCARYYRRNGRAKPTYYQRVMVGLRKGHYANR